MIALLAAVLTVLLGCTTAEVECDNQTPCAFGEDCIAGLCVAGSCSTSVQCPMEYHCVNRDCRSGCAEDRDCYPGYACSDEGECVEDACETTSVDCGFREFCNGATGDCYDAGGDYCRPCSEAQIDCDEGNLCYGGYCLVDCSGGRECPSGFECYGFTDGTDNIIFYGCFTYCWLYEDYDPGSFVRAPQGAIQVSDECATGEPAYALEAR